MRSAGARENGPCSIEFLTMVITIPKGINTGASGWNIFRMVSERNEEMLKWFVLELFLSKPFFGTALEKILMLALKQF